MLFTTLVLAMFVTPLVPHSGAASAVVAATIPLTCDAQSTVLVPVSIQGAPARRFLLDTGTSLTMVDEGLAAQLGLPAAGRIASTGGIAALVTAQLTIGPTTLPPGPVATADFRKLSHLLGNVSGILGSDALRAMGYSTIDFARCRLTIGSTETDRRSSSVSGRMPLEWHQGRPVVRTAGGARLLLDSGATTVTVFSDAPATRALQWSAIAASPIRIDRVDGPRVGRLGRLASLTIGQVDLPGVPAIGVTSWYDKDDAGAPDGILPLGLFSRVHFSHAESYVVLVPRSHVATR